jgi:hypothetical protein
MVVFVVVPKDAQKSPGRRAVAHWTQREEGTCRWEGVHDIERRLSSGLFTIWKTGIHEEGQYYSTYM